MERKIGIAADCSSGVAYAPFKNSVEIMKTTIHFGEEELLDGVDITADQFYEKLKNSDVVPSTSAPTYQVIGEVIESFKAKGYKDCILFTISTGLSTYGTNLEQLKDELYEGINVHVVDSKTACIMEGYQAYYAEKLDELGYSVKDILEEVKKIQMATNAYFVVDDLKYLVKNGRLSSAAGLIGSLVQIKPLLNLGNEDKIITFDKVRTKKAAIIKAIDLIKQEAINAKKVIYVVLHTGLKEEAEEYAKQLECEVSNALRVEVTTITPTVGAHIGNGIIGFARIILDDLKEGSSL